jgi:putative endonuclease
MAESHSLGQLGENLAVEHLLNSGYRIRHRNWKSGKHEVDIIAENNDFIVFVEVKTRSENYQLHPSGAVTTPKQQAIILVAEKYINYYNIDKESRFDIISVISNGKTHSIDHIVDAFYPTLNRFR